MPTRGKDYLLDTTALMTVDIQDGPQVTATHRFWSASAEPLFTIPALADYYTWVTGNNLPLSAATYCQYAAGKASLPANALSGNELTATAQVPRFCYHLILAANAKALHFSIGIGADTSPVHTLTHASLYAAAALCCDQIAARAQHFADTHNDIALPGADPNDWAMRAGQYRLRLRSTAITAAAANLDASFLPSTFDAAYPAIRIVGVLVFGYIDPDGTLHVSVDLDEAEPWLAFQPRGTVPMRISVGGIDVYAAPR
ncbi:MAG TPA: hypothetical protein VFC19_18535 [Candidatus Limnocylindrales bacterium]|nr:hypothetical protein [Candidatus Limnocylindrales bacterium]